MTHKLEINHKLEVNHKLKVSHSLASRNSKFIVRLLAVGLTLLLISTTTPLAALALPEIPHHADTPAPPPANVQVKTGPRSVTIVKPELKLSAAPTDLELTTARVFQEPLVPMSTSAVAGENVALALAIKVFKNASVAVGKNKSKNEVDKSNYDLSFLFRGTQSPEPIARLVVADSGIVRYALSDLL